jgi:hypothetical protein
MRSGSRDNRNATKMLKHHYGDDYPVPSPVGARAVTIVHFTNLEYGCHTGWTEKLAAGIF